MQQGEEVGASTLAQRMVLGRDKLCSLKGDVFKNPAAGMTSLINHCI